MLIVFSFAIFIIGICANRYLMPKKYDGTIDVATNKAGIKVASLDFNKNAPQILNTKSSITFKVVRK